MIIRQFELIECLSYDIGFYHSFDMPKKTIVARHRLTDFINMQIDAESVAFSVKAAIIEAIEVKK